MEMQSLTTKRRWIVNLLGFQRVSGGCLFMLFGGMMLAFVIVRSSYFNIAGDARSSFKNGAAPGEWYIYRRGILRVGISLHLWAALPCGFLMIWQFVPAIRYGYILLHRINGYIVIVLALLSNVGALIICGYSMNGAVETQVAVTTLAAMSTTAISVAYYNIKRLQIDQHRAWMLRAMFYLGSIITMRPIMIISAIIISSKGGYYQAQSCDKIAFINNSSAEAIAVDYPGCTGSGQGSEKMVTVLANMFGGRKEQKAAALTLTFGMAVWLAISLHLILVEIYLALTPAEAERLRSASYEKQLKAGFEPPGRAGLTLDRWKDAPKKAPLQLL